MALPAPDIVRQNVIIVAIMDAITSPRSVLEWPISFHIANKSIAMPAMTPNSKTRHNVQRTMMRLNFQKAIIFSDTQLLLVHGSDREQESELKTATARMQR